MPSGLTYWTVLDSDLEVVAAADRFLRQIRLGQDGAELTTKTYAGAVALFWRWCVRTGRDWRTAAADMGLFMTWLRHAPKEISGPDPAPYGGELLVGPGRAPARGARRINLILTAVRAFLMYGVTVGEVRRGDQCVGDRSQSGGRPVVLLPQPAQRSARPDPCSRNRTIA
jgi:hypothetical protein